MIYKALIKNRLKHKIAPRVSYQDECFVRHIPVKQGCPDSRPLVPKPNFVHCHNFLVYLRFILCNAFGSGG